MFSFNMADSLETIPNNIRGLRYIPSTKGYYMLSIFFPFLLLIGK